MSRQDPGDANSTGVYPVDPDCQCGCMAAVHAIGQRGGQQMRTGCSRSGCPCARYVSGPVERETTCQTCGARMSPIEAARLR
jgi:hypothetical protein